MTEALVIYLHANDLAHPSWAVVSLQQQVLQSAWHDSADGLKQIAEDKKVIVIVPSQDVLLLKTQLPKMNERRLLQAVPFALEEQLIEDVQNLHFAIREEAGIVYTAVIAQQKMQTWLSLLQAWEITPQQMFPLSLMQTYEKNSWSAILTENLVAVKTDRLSAFTADTENFPTLLTLAITESSAPPTELILHNYSDHEVALSLGVLCKEIKSAPETFIADLARQCNQDSIDLLQGKYAVKKVHFSALNKISKSLMYLASVWVALLFLYPLVSYFILRERNVSIHQEIVAIYHRNFPNATTVIAPKLRLQEKLQHLTTGANDSKALTLIAYVGKGISTFNNIKLKKMDFQNSQLTLDVIAQSSDDLASFTDFLTQHGLNVKQQNAHLINAQVNTTLVVE